MLNKRGQGMSTNAIILIILGVVVLVVLILGFTMGWSKFAPWLSGNNVDNIGTACEASCATSSDFDFCSVEREIKDGTNDKFKATCNQLATDEAYQNRNYGISECSSITCAE